MKKILYTVLACFMLLVGSSTELITASQATNNTTITPAAASLITYDLNVVSDLGSNNDIKYTVTNVSINTSSAGYKSLAITVPPEFVANYTLPASWAEHISGNTINFIISTPASTGTVPYITDFLENSFSMTLATENVFPTQAVNLTINISENLLSSRVDNDGNVHYYEFIPANYMSWLDAYNEAKSRTINGLSGYLATITSQEEQDFIYNSIAKTGGWLGATRMRNITTNTRINDESSISNVYSEYETAISIANDWYWANGPEAGTVFLNGATGSNYVPGQFNYWGVNQPDNGGNEVVMQFAFSGSRWNDLSIVRGDFALGYYVEYGGYPNEQPLQDNAGYQVTIPAPVKLEYLDLANNSLFISEYLFGNTGENYTAPSAPSAPVGYAYLGLDSSSDPATGKFQDTMLVVTHRYGQLFDASFHLNYTTSNTPPSTQTIAETQLLNTVTSPSRSGYTFTGWNELADGSGNVWDFTSTTMPANNVVLYAQWEKMVDYVLQFDLNGGQGVTPENQTLYEGQKATKPVTPSRDGYIFKEWNTVKDGSGEAWNFDSSTMSASDVTLYAQWIKNDLPVTGDSSNAILFSMLLILAGVTLVAINNKKYSK